MFKTSYCDLFAIYEIIKNKQFSNYEKCKTYSDFLHIYCSQEIKSINNIGHDISLLDSAKLAFEIYNNRAQDISSMRHNPTWSLIHEHSTIRDFLLAYYVIHKIKMYADEDTNIDDLKHVYPFNINRFCKEIMNFDNEDQIKILAGIMNIYNKHGEDYRAHNCYLAGRMEDRDVQQDAIKFLTECKKEYKKKKNKNDTELLTERTIYISLIQLEDSSSSEEYINLLLNDKESDKINRGFHLEYYGDIKVKYNHNLQRKDPLEDFSYTYERLYPKVSESIESRINYPLRDIELYTLISLAQHRHINNSLNEDKRISLLNLCKTAIEINVFHEFKSYLERMSLDLAQKTLSILDILSLITDLKKEKRAGWVERKYLIGESVADHSWGAATLALLLLPEEGSKPYNKDKIIRMLLLHDISETVTGDKSKNPRSKNVVLISPYKGV